jgi:ribosomal protein L12E/L44/L45/RPP1/RPP2
MSLDAYRARMRFFQGSWRVLHDAKNELTAAILLLGRMQAGVAVDPKDVETLLRRTAVQLDEVFNDVEVAPGSARARHRRYLPRRRREGSDTAPPLRVRRS